MGKDKQKTFLVFNTASLGDLLLCNPLCQNIRLQYPDSRIVFVVNRTFADVARKLKDVDDVIIFDKKGEHKGILGLIKFIISFKYKGSCCSFLTYSNIRNYAVALFSGSKRIISHDKNLGRMCERHSRMLKNYSDKDVENLPMVYVSDGVADNKFDFLNDKYVAICPVCENTDKDVPAEVTSNLIKELKNRGYKVVFTGLGDYAMNYAKSLNVEESDFLNLIDKTSVDELAYVLKKSVGLISADTGTMHLGCACGIPVVGMFYRDNTIEKWAPDENIYNSKTLFRENNAQKVCDTLLELTEK